MLKFYYCYLAINYAIIQLDVNKAIEGLLLFDSVTLFSCYGRCQFFLRQHERMQYYQLTMHTYLSRNSLLMSPWAY